MARGADIVGRIARGGLGERLLGRANKPLRLHAVPRDHVEGQLRIGRAIASGTLIHGGEELDLRALDFNAIGTTPAADHLRNFAWLRDFSEVASREQGAPIAQAIAARWLMAHGEKQDHAWTPAAWGERLLFWIAYAPYLLSSEDNAYRKAFLNMIARGARYLAEKADKADNGLERITAYCGLTAACLAVEGGLPRVARSEAGLMRALAQGQYEDGGLTSRNPLEQLALVDRLALTRAVYFAAKQSLPGGLEDAAAAALAALHGVTMGDGALASWQGANPGDAARVTAVVQGCGLRARPLRNPRGWGYHRLSALGTIVVMDAAPPPVAGHGNASTLAFELSDGAQRLVVNCGGPGHYKSRLPGELVEALRSSAAHSTLIVDDHNSISIQPDGQLGRGVSDVEVERREDNDASRIEAAHDGYEKRYGLTHRRRLMLGNDGKELVGSDQLVAKGRFRRAKNRRAAIRFHLAPGVDVTPTADGMGAILTTRNSPAWNFRCRGAHIAIEDSLHIDGLGQPIPCQQIVIERDIPREGLEIDWLFRRTS